MNKISMIIQEDKNEFLLFADNTYNLKKGIIKKLLSNIPYSLFLGMLYPFSVMLGVLLFKNSTNDITPDNFFFGLFFLFVFTAGIMLLVFRSSVLFSFYYYKNNIDKRKDLISQYPRSKGRCFDISVIFSLMIFLKTWIMLIKQ